MNQEKEIELSDLKDIVPTAGFRVPSNNQRTRFYPIKGMEYGVLRDDYEGFPARGTVLWDVTGYEIIEYDFEQLESERYTKEEEFEMFEEDIREWIDQVLFVPEGEQRGSGMSRAQANLFYGGFEKIRLKNPWEGDEYIIEMETENKRRVI